MPTWNSVPAGAGLALTVKYLEVGGELWLVHLRGWERSGRALSSRDSLYMDALDVERLVSGVRDVASGIVDDFLSWDWCEGGPERLHVARLPSSALAVSVATAVDCSPERMRSVDAHIRSTAAHPDIIRFETSSTEALRFATRLEDEVAAAPRLRTK